MRKEPSSILGACAGIVLLWLASTGGASAYVRGSIGPEFTVGSTDYGFGWKANILVDTNTGTCYSGSTYAGITSWCTGATLVSATGGLYDPYPTNQIFPTTVGTSFSFTTSPSTFHGISVYFDGSTVVGMNTGPIGYYTLAAGAVNDGTILDAGQYMWVELLYAPQPNPNPAFGPTTNSVQTGLQTGDLLLQALCPTVIDYEDDRVRSNCATCTPSPTAGGVLAGYAGPNDITLSVVPEPGSIALICGGLLAAGFIRRRQQLH
jgi:PEP-CTERM motif